LFFDVFRELNFVFDEIGSLVKEVVDLGDKRLVCVFDFNVTVFVYRLADEYFPLLLELVDSS
jgi:hypothetical protein